MFTVTIGGRWVTGSRRLPPSLVPSELMAIRLVTFDVLHTIVTPRLPIYVQYSQTFEHNLGVLDPDALKQAFKTGTYIVMFAVLFACWPS